MKSSLFRILSFASLSLILAAGTVGCKKPQKPLTPITGQKNNVGSTGGPKSNPFDNTFNNGRPVQDQNPVAVTPDPNSEGIKQNRSHGNLADRPKDREALKAQTAYFEYDKFGIKSSEKNKLEAVAAYMRANEDKDVLVEGHCDERGTEGYNLSLGDRRALSLRELLVTSYGVSAERVHTISYGEAKPAVDGHDEAAWSQNRRGEFVVLGAAQ